MIARAVIILLILASTPISTSAQDPPPEPPVRLKKKDKPRPPAESEKDKSPRKEEKEPPAPAGKGAESSPSTEPGMSAEEALARVVREMETAEQRLAKQDAGEGTRQVQRDILKHLDQFIEAKKHGQSAAQQQQSQQKDKQDARQQSAAQERQRKEQRQARASQSPTTARKPDQPNPQTGMGAARKEERASKIADLYKDVWGHLPETLRQEMDQYSREQFMARYNDLLKQYYATVAAKGRRKSE